jgi:hypothetical protein
MRLVALLAVVVISGLLFGRLWGGKPGAAPGAGADSSPRTLRQVEKLVEGAGQADQRRLDGAMEGLR